jgi:hypothetical protein
LTGLNIVFIEIGKSFPIVRKYQNYWPVRDMIKLHLKNTSELFRKGALKKGGHGREKAREKA